VPHRTHGWVWAGRVVASAIVIGSAVYLYRVGFTRANEVAAPVMLVVALATLFAPYLFPAYQPPTRPSESAGAAQTSAIQPRPDGVVIIADRGSVGAQRIGHLTMNAPERDREPRSDESSQ
jgi:hypothetical protein